MLILIGTVPTAYALNRALPASHIAEFAKASAAASKVVEAKAAGYQVLGDPRPAVTNYVATHELNEGTYPSLAALIRDISQEVECYGAIAKIPLARWATPVTTSISPRRRCASCQGQCGAAHRHRQGDAFDL